MGFRSWYSNSDVAVKAAVAGAIIAGVSGVITAIVVALVAVLSGSGGDHTGSAPPPGGTSSGRSPTPSSTCAKKLTLTAPSNGQKVAGLVGVEVTGRACGLVDGEAAWVFEQDLYDQNFYLVYDRNIGPRAVLSGDGEFATLDKPIGDPGDDRKTYVIAAVLASSDCNRSIVAKRPDAYENYVFRPLPAGCKIIDQREIFESQP